MGKPRLTMHVSPCIDILLLSVLMAIPVVVSAQDSALSVFVPSVDDTENDTRPATVPANVAQSRATQFILNDHSFNFSAGGMASVPLNFGPDRTLSSTALFTKIGDIGLAQALDASPQGLRLRSTQSATVVQLGLFERQRSTARETATTGQLLGLRLELSVTGKCALPDNGPDDYCTYTPGFATSPSLTDPATFAPTGFIFTSEFGDVIPEATHRSLAVPGFQRGEAIAGGPLVGADIDTQNSGFAEDPFSISGRRTETSDLILIPSFGQIDQTLYTNDTQAAIARTKRFFVLPGRADFTADYIMMQLAAGILPAVSAEVAYRAAAPLTAVNNNLFIALNNARLPRDSYTMFETGRADLAIGPGPVRSAKETPVAYYAGLWMGLSPVREVRLRAQTIFERVGPRASVSDPTFAEGGIGTPFESLLQSGLTIIDNFDRSVTDLNLQNIDDLYIQLGIDLTQQQAIRRNRFTETSGYRLVPHLAVNGNRTDGEQVLRYYAGAILTDQPNLYLGADYTLATANGYNAFARLDVYSDPTFDYENEAELRISKAFPLSAERSIAVGGGGIAGLGGISATATQPVPDDHDLTGDLFVQFREGAYRFSAIERYSAASSGRSDQSTTLGLDFSKDRSFAWSARYTPQATETSFVEASLGVNIALDPSPDAPVFEARVDQIYSSFGTTQNGAVIDDRSLSFLARMDIRF